MAKNPTRGVQLDYLQDDGRVELIEILESVSCTFKINSVFIQLAKFTWMFVYMHVLIGILFSCEVGSVWCWTLLLEDF